MDIVNEFRNGPYAINDEEWSAVMVQPRDLELKVLEGLDAALAAHDSPK